MNAQHMYEKHVVGPRVRKEKREKRYREENPKNRLEAVKFRILKWWRID